MSWICGESSASVILRSLVYGCWYWKIDGCTWGTSLGTSLPWLIKVIVLALEMSLHSMLRYKWHCKPIQVFSKIQNLKKFSSKQVVISWYPGSGVSRSLDPVLPTDVFLKLFKLAGFGFWSPAPTVHKEFCFLFQHKHTWLFFYLFAPFFNTDHSSGPQSWPSWYLGM